MSGGGRHRLGESALDRARGVEEDTDWERADLRVEGNGVGEVTDWERAHLIVEGNEWKREMSTGREHTCKGGNGVEERNADWERAHLRVEGNKGQRCQLGESALDRVGMVWRREMPTGRWRT